MTATLMAIGRIMLVAIFFISGVTKAMAFAGTAQYIASKGLPQAEVLAGLTIALEIGGALLIAINRFVAPVALLFAAFCLATALLFHNFWAADAAAQMVERINFMKNIALAGAFLILAAAAAPERA